jgi:cation diffusion facilitator family transporter
VSDVQKSGLQESQRGAWVSIFAYLLLTTLKFGVGWWSGSKALVADGVNNLTDVVGSVTVLLGLRLALLPPDEDHKYGHQKAETIAAVIVAAIMGLIGLNVLIDTARAIFAAEAAAPHAAAMPVGLLSASLMLLVSRYNHRLAQQTGSKALEAAAHDNRSDALTSLGTVAGILFARWGWRWADPVMGLFIALVIIKTAWEIGYDAANLLMDGFAPEELHRIRERVMDVQGVQWVRGLRARHLGQVVAVELTIGVSPSLSIVEAHDVSHHVEEVLLGWNGIEHVHVHMEPDGKRR